MFTSYKRCNQSCCDVSCMGKISRLNWNMKNTFKVRLDFAIVTLLSR